MQRSAGLYGSLIVDVAKGKSERLRYDGEFNLLLSDWWHEAIPSQELGLSSKPMRWIGEAQVLFFLLSLYYFYLLKQYQFTKKNSKFVLKTKTKK
jgi:hypothetical protein